MLTIIVIFLVSLVSTSKGSHITSPPILNNLLDGIGSRRILQETFYNETNSTEICWLSTLYVNETNNEDVNSWNEYQMVLTFDGESQKQENNSLEKEFREYGIQTDHGVLRYPFEVIERKGNWVLSKHENISCGEGRFLFKAIYNEGGDKKKIVIKVADKFSRFNEQPELNDGNDHDHDDDDENDVPIVASPHRSAGLFATTTTTTEKPLIKELKNDTVPHGMNNPQIKRRRTKPSELRKIFEVSTETSASSPQVPSVDPCLPIISQLFAGHAMLPNLCNITRDEKVLLQGDILVSRKYNDKKTRQEMVKPLFVIHENTEIEASAKE